MCFMRHSCIWHSFMRHSCIRPSFMRLSCITHCCTILIHVGCYNGLAETTITYSHRSIRQSRCADGHGMHVVCQLQDVQRVVGCVCSVSVTGCVEGRGVCIVCQLHINSNTLQRFCRSSKDSYKLHEFTWKFQHPAYLTTFSGDFCVCAWWCVCVNVCVCSKNITAYEIRNVISSISNLDRWTSFLSLFWHVPLKTDRRDSDRKFSLNDTPNASGCIYTHIYQCMGWLTWVDSLKL